MELKRVVVTGIGALTPVGNNLQDYWKGLLNGVSGAAFITLFDASKFKTRFACELKGFDPLQWLERKEARKLDRFTQTALVASDEAVADAGIDAGTVNTDRVGVVFASGIGRKYGEDRLGSGALRGGVVVAAWPVYLLA